MDSKDDTLHTDRMRFVAAIMTKDYAKAINLGTSIMIRDPNDHHVRRCLSALNKIRKSKKIELSNSQGSSSADNRTGETALGTKEIDQAGSSSRNIDEVARDRVMTDVGGALNQEKLCQSKSVKSLVECVRETVLSKTVCTNDKLSNFFDKMYRAIPLKFMKKK